MYFKILGPLSVTTRDGNELHPGGSLQRVVMAMLLLDAGRVVPMSRLIEAAWGGFPPETARNQIQIRVSQLRRALGDTAQPYDLLRTTPPGYLINAGPGRLDLADFEQLTARARREEPGQAARTLRQALALWRGPALSDVGSDLVRTIAHGLQERRLLAHEQCVELELAAGRREQLVAELRALVRDNPLRERLHGLLMLALYRSGRQADALEVFRAYRAMLSGTLGLAPGEELRRLELAVLNQDAGLDGPAPPRPMPVPRQLPPMISHLAGRTTELRRICSLLGDVREDTERTLPVEDVRESTERALPVEDVRESAEHALPVGDARESAERALPVGTARESAERALPVVAVIGEGKSEVALQAAHRLAPAYPDGHLYVDLRSGDLRPADVLSRFLRALDVPAVPSRTEERAALFRSTVAGRRVLLLLDNAGSGEQVRPLLPGGAPCGVLITSRHHPAGLPDRNVVRLPRPARVPGPGARHHR